MKKVYSFEIWNRSGCFGTEVISAESGFDALEKTKLAIERIRTEFPSVVGDNTIHIRNLQKIS